MKFPINIEEFIRQFQEMYPGNESGDAILRALLPMVNDAYQQGIADAAHSRAGMG